MYTMISMLLALLVPCEQPDSIDPYFTPSEVNIVKIDGVYMGDLKSPTVIITNDTTYILDESINSDSCIIDSLVRPIILRP